MQKHNNLLTKTLLNLTGLEEKLETVKNKKTDALKTPGAARPPPISDLLLMGYYMASSGCFSFKVHTRSFFIAQLETRNFKNSSISLTRHQVYFVGMDLKQQ